MAPHAAQNRTSVAQDDGGSSVSLGDGTEAVLELSLHVHNRRLIGQQLLLVDARELEAPGAVRRARQQQWQRQSHT